MKKFIEISREEFEGLLGGLGLGPPTQSVVGNELTYSFDLKGVSPSRKSWIVLKIYSSIQEGEEKMRARGADAIRMVLWDRVSSKMVGKTSHTKRIQGFENRVVKKVEKLIGLARDTLYCPDCGSHLVERARTSDNETFYGCSRYPRCKFTSDSAQIYYDNESSFSHDVLGVIDRAVDISDPVLHFLKLRGELESLLIEKMADRKNELTAVHMRIVKAIRLIDSVDDDEVLELTEALSSSGSPDFTEDIQRNLKILEKFVYGRKRERDPIDVVVDGPIPFSRFKREMADVFGLDGVKVELVPTSEFPFFGFPFKYFNPMQSAVVDFVENDCNLVVASPTASGKTQVAEMFIAESVSRDKKAVYLAPMKALSDERLEDFTGKGHPFSELNVCILTGDFVLNDAKKKELEEADVIIATNECLDTRTRLHKEGESNWIDEIGVVVVDEAHLLTLSGRGDSTETALIRFSEINSGAKIVLLSATMANVKELGRWLTSMNSKETAIVDSFYRPVRLTVERVDIPREQRYSLQEARRLESAVALVEKYPTDKFLLFVGNKRFGRSINEALNRKGIDSVFHSADLTREERVKVERSFKDPNGKVRVLVSTSTTAWGVNLPARRVVVCHTSFGPTKMPACDVQQMVGRSGRPKYDTEGTAYILIPSGDDEEWERVTAPQYVESRLSDEDVLEFHVVAEIYRGRIRGVVSFMDWYRKSLAFQQARSPDITPMQLFERLKEYGVVYKDHVSGEWFVTNLGKICSWLYFSPRTVSCWARNLFWYSELEIDQERFNERTLFGELVDVKDAMFSVVLTNGVCSDSYVSRSEVDMVGNFVDLVRDASAGKDDKTNLQVNPDMKHAMSIYASLRGIDVEGNYALIARSFARDSDRVFQALKLIDSMVTRTKLSSDLKSYSVRVKYGVTEELVDLVSIVGIGRVSAYHLYEAGLKCKDDILQNQSKFLGVVGKRGLKILEKLTQPSS